MNVHMHTQLRLVRIKYIQKRVQRVTPYAKCILYFMQINANLWESSLRGRGVYSSRSFNCFPYKHFYPWISFHNFSKSENSPDPPPKDFYCNLKQLYKKNLKIKIVLPKQDCQGKKSDVEFSMIQFFWNTMYRPTHELRVNNNLIMTQSNSTSTLNPIHPPLPDDFSITEQNWRMFWKYFLYCGSLYENLRNIKIL